MPITTKLQGGLGNQLFQIANCIAYGLRTGMEFQIPQQMDGEQYPVYFDHLPKLTLGFENFGYMQETSFNYQPYPKKEQICFIGYYQSWKYFWDFKDQVFELILAGFDKVFAGNAKFSIKPGIVAMHVRRGDYLKYPDIFPFVGQAYISLAIKYFNDRGYNKFNIFSDDIEWCRENIEKNTDHLGDNTFYFSSNHFGDDQKKNAMADMLLMSMHEHQIISNSTFSLWAAMLNKNINKIIVCPSESNWFGSGVPDLGPAYESIAINARDLIPENFVQIDAKKDFVEKLQNFINSEKEETSTAEVIETVLRIGNDNICPITNKPCDDETCSPGAECNISGNQTVISSPDSEFIASEVIETKPFLKLSEMHPDQSIGRLERESKPVEIIQIVPVENLNQEPMQIFTDGTCPITNLQCIDGCEKGPCLLSSVKNKLLK